MTTDMGCTALSMAVEMGYDEACRLLIHAKAVVDAPLEDGKTPLMLACKNGHVSTTQLLLDYDAEERHRENDATPTERAEQVHAACESLTAGVPSCFTPY